MADAASGRAASVRRLGTSVFLSPFFDEIGERSGSLPRPVVAQNLCLFQDKLGGPCLFVGWIAVATQDALDDDSHLSPHVLAHGPVNGHAPLDGPDKFLRNDPQRFIAQNGHGTVVDFQGVVEGNLVVGESELLATLFGLAHLPGQGDQLLDDLGRFDGPALVAPDGLLQQLGERPELLSNVVDEVS